MSVVGAACALGSVVALVLYGFGRLPMYFLIDTLALPSLGLLLISGIVAKRINEEVFLNRLWIGVWGGLVATLAYDLVRFLIWKAQLITFNPFLTNQVFGLIITGYPVTSVSATIVGWVYHFWNGFGLGTVYTLLAGPAHWYYALIWALILELGWLAAMPTTLHFRLTSGFIAVSLIGHAAYGLVLGIIASRLIRE